MSRSGVWMPPPSLGIGAALQFAGHYDAYRRWASSDDRLGTMLDPIEAVFHETGQLPQDLGFDAARAFLFFSYRAHHFQSAGDDSDEVFMTLYTAIYERFHNVPTIPSPGDAFAAIPGWAHALDLLRADLAVHGDRATQDAHALGTFFQGRRGAMVVEVVASRQRRYDTRVLAIVKEFERQHPDPTLSTLAEQGPGDGLGLRPGEADTMRTVAQRLLDYCEKTGLDEDEGCRAWAEGASAFEYASSVEPVVGTVPGIGPALFAYLRMRSGADALKPDVRVSTYLGHGPGGYGLPVPTGYDPNGLLLLANALAEAAHIRPLVLDQLLWRKGSPADA